MIFLEYHNRILERAIQQRLDSERQESVDITFCDFDGIQFHVCTEPEAKNLVNVSISLKCYDQLRSYGVEDIIKKEYGSLVTAPRAGYDVSLQFDLNSLPADADKLPRKLALLKRHVLSAPFRKAFEAIDARDANAGMLEVQYRDDEAFYLKPAGDRLTCIFSISFRDADDVTFSRVFLQEFVDARRTIRSAPSVSFSQKDPPGELSGLNVAMGENNGFVSFSLFAEQLAPKNREATIDHMLIFRDYLHYHIKCSKAYLHTRMRSRVASLLQVLNRAKQPLPAGEARAKKNIYGKTFTRK